MNVTFAILGLGGMELFLIFVVIVFFFGAKKLPGLAKGMGNSIKEFKRGMHEEAPSAPAPKKPVYVEKN